MLIRGYMVPIPAPATNQPAAATTGDSPTGRRDELVTTPATSNDAPHRKATAADNRSPSRPWTAEASAHDTAAAVSVTPESQAGRPYRSCSSSGR